MPESARYSASRYEKDLLVERQDDSALAHQFLITVRSFLHYRSQRDDNMLYWQAQDEAAKLRLGVSTVRSRRQTSAPPTPPDGCVNIFAMPAQSSGSPGRCWMKSPADVSP